MRRILAFYIDHMFLSIIIVGSVFSLLNFGGSGIPISLFPVMLLAGLVLWLGYFIAAAIIMFLAVLIGILIFTLQRISAVDYYTLGDEKIA